MATGKKTHRNDLPFSPAELHAPELPGYTGESLKMISFPLGGIGTGTIGLGGRGELRDWEIFNNPNSGYRPPYTMPFIFCKQGRNKLAKVLERKLLPPFHAARGLSPEQLPGLPRLSEALFIGTYPVARIIFQDDELPVEVSLEAFNPMIPGSPEDSAIPAAVLVYRLKNRTRRNVSGSIAISMANTVGLSCGDGLGGNVNAFRRAGGVCGLHMTGAKYAAGTIGYGTEALVTTARKITCATDFDEPGWWDRGQRLWDDYSADGRLDGPTKRTPPTNDGKTRIGMLAAEYNLKARASTEIIFVVTWSFPHRPAAWLLPPGREPQLLRNHYARRFPEAWKAARYVVANLDRLRGQTLWFEQALFESTLPGNVLDAVSSQMSTIRTNTTMWLDSPEDEPAGRIFAFEGCNAHDGSCPMNCTHVWNYEQSLGHLYPSLERTMRLTDYEQNIHHGGAMAFRTRLPLKSHLPPWNPKTPAADGQFGTVLKVYREWRISGDDRWLKRLWPSVKKSITFAWKGFTKWDADKDGVMEGVQHNTYDISFHGPNTMCGSLYLAALLAGAEIAEAVGETKAAAEFRRMFASGKQKYDRMLFNGQFYEQRVTETNKGARPKYQYGCGCLCDQLLGQWAAHVAGIGYIFPAQHVKKAIAAVFRNNFKPDLSAHQCSQRVYALGDEAGVVNCTWPNGKREKFPFPYSDEVWTGVEYQLAAHLIYEGFVDEGLTVVAAARGRHDGASRNPWNEFECGDHYARAMSSWSVLLALSGQQYDGRSQRLSIKPVVNQKDFRCLYTANDAYGTFAQKLAKTGLAVTIDSRAGRVGLSSIVLSWPGSAPSKKLSVRVLLNGVAAEASACIEAGNITIKLHRRIVLRAGDVLIVKLN